MNLLKKLSVIGLVAVFSFAMVGMALADSASDYTSQADCSDAGYYWYTGNETCYETENAKLSAQVSNLLERIDSLTATIAELTGDEEPEPATGGDVPAVCEGVTFDRALDVGMSGDDVLCLQTMLNQDLDSPIADSGPGSPGNETSYFGSITKGGVVTFQENYSEDVLAPWDLTQGTGYVGKTTREKLNSLLDQWAAEEKAPGDYTEQSACEDAGYYWYDEACHEEEEGEEVTGEGLQLELADDNPSTQSVPLAAQHVPFLKVDMTAASKDVDVSSITFTRTGIGSRNDFDKLWLEDSTGKILTNGKTVNSQDEVTFNYLNDTIEEGETKTYTLKADLGGTSGNINALQISGSSDIDSDAGELTGDFPVEGNQMSLTSYGIGSTTFEKVGSGTTTIAVGDEEITVGEFKLSPTSNNSNDFVFRSVRIKETGSANIADLDNITLHDPAGSKLADGTVDGNYVSFSGIDYDIEDGDSRNFSVRADVINGTDGDVFTFKLNKGYDLFVEENVGYGSAVSGDVSLANYKINAGSFSVNKHSSQPSNDDYSPDTNNIVGLVGEMDLDQDVTVSGLELYLHSDSYATSTSDIDNDIENISLYKDGTLIDSLSSVSGSATSNISASNQVYYDFSNTFTLSDGDKIKVEFDLKSGATASNDYKFKIGASDFKTPEYTESGDSVASADQTGTANGRKVTVTSAAVTATRNDGFPTDHAIVQGSTDVTMMEFVLEAGVSSDVEINKLDVDLSGAEDSSNYTNVKLMAGSSQVGSTQDVGTDNNVKFESLSYDVAAGDTQQFSLKTDIDSSASTTDLYFVVDMVNSLFYDGSSNQISISAGNNATSAKLKVTTGGTLTVSSDSDPTSDVLDAVADNDTVGGWTFVAENDTIDVTDLYFANDINSSATTATSTMDSRIKDLKLYVDGEEHATGKVLTSGTVHFNLGSTNAFTVGENNPVDVDLKADFNSISDKSQTNKQLRLGLYSLSALSSSGSSLSSASGVGTLDNSTYSTSSAANSARANEFVVDKSRPTLASNSSAAETGSAPNGTVKTYAFDVSAPNSGAVTFKKVILNVSGVANGSSIGGSTTTEWRDFATSSVIYRGNTSKTATVTEATTTVTIEFSSVQTVTAGNTATFVYETQLSGFDLSSGTSDYVETNIKSAASTYKAAKTYSNQSGNGNFIWSDNSGTYQSETKAHWMTEYLFNELNLSKVKIEV